MSVSRCCRAALLTSRRLASLRSVAAPLTDLQGICWSGQKSRLKRHCRVRVQAVIERQGTSLLVGSQGSSASCSAAPSAWSATTRCFASSSIEDETHDDFRPQVKSSPANSAADQIKQDISSSKVFIYMKVYHQGILESIQACQAPATGYCHQCMRSTLSYARDTQVGACQEHSLDSHEGAMLDGRPAGFAMTTWRDQRSQCMGLGHNRGRAWRISCERQIIQLLEVAPNLA